jgi:hypothetical protein
LRQALTRSREAIAILDASRTTWRHGRECKGHCVAKRESSTAPADVLHSREGGRDRPADIPS